MIFDPHQPDTFPLVLTVAEVAQIFRTSPAAVKKAVQRGTFKPEPYQRKPMQWRRADVQQRALGDVAYARAAATLRDTSATLRRSLLRVR